jgi:ABC-type multidrug transport system fused ATPase/permease subunit
MISNTYFFSFLFSSESSAQNGVILINFLIGGLASTVALIFRGLESAATVGKIFVYVFGIIPSFNFSYGYSYLLNKYLVWIVDKPNTWMYLTDKDSLGIKYLGLQILYLCVLFVLYTFFVILFEIYEYKLKECKNEKIKNESEDDNVNKEINYVQNVIDNIDNNVQIDKEEENNKIKHPIIVQNLQKFYTKFNFCSNNEKIPAVKNLNFCTNSGECFGLLGTNGAGKTTTFK